MEQKPTALRWRLRRRGRDGFASSAQRVWQRCLRRTPTLIGCVCLFRTAGRAKGRKTITRPRGASRGAEPRLSGGDICKAEAPGRFLCGHFVCTLLQSALAGRAVLAGDASCRTGLTQWKSPFQSAPLLRAAARLRSAHRPDQQFPSAPLLRAATGVGARIVQVGVVSIHAALTSGGQLILSLNLVYLVFLSAPLSRAATGLVVLDFAETPFFIRAALAGGLSGASFLMCFEVRHEASIRAALAGRDGGFLSARVLGAPLRPDPCVRCAGGKGGALSPCPRGRPCRSAAP